MKNTITEDTGSAAAPITGESSKIKRRRVTAQNRALALPTGRQLIVRSWRDLRADWRHYSLIVALMAVPLFLMAVAQGISGESTYGTLSTVLSVLMIVVLVYSMTMVKRGHRLKTVRAAYYDGSALLVRYSLVLASLMVLMVPGALGVWLMMLPFSSAIDYMVTNTAVIVFSVICGLILSLPSWWLVPRFVLGLYVTALEGLTPWAALRRGRALTLGRYWRVLARILVGMAVVFIASLAIIAVAAIIGVFWFSMIDAVFGLLFSMLVLPWMTLYWINLYLALAGDPVVISDATGTKEGGE